ncbi:MAG TPA: OmpA family protein [Rhizobiaceae bacterium]|nr:OmpA family protein [Rhizobiaceae bacterium]
MNRKSAIFLATTLALGAASGPSYAQEKITYGQAIAELSQTGKSAKKVGIDADAIRRDIQARIQADGAENATGAPPIADVLKDLPNFIVQIQFDLGSDVIKPESWVTVGRIADALHNPLLLSDRFLVVGHTDAKGTRPFNLELSQKRADAVVEMLVNTFRVPPDQLIALGLGEEQLFNPKDPFSGANRRVAILNIGPR